MKPQRVGIGVFGIPLDLMIPEEQRRVLLDRPRRAGARIQAARRITGHLGGVPLRLLGDRDRPLLGVEGAGRSVTPVSSLVDAPVAHPLLALPAFRISHGQASELGRTARLHPTPQTSITWTADLSEQAKHRIRRH
jgi:hypothetical protein